MDKEEERRRGVTDADDTGLISGEELITQAETILPIQELHAALPSRHDAHETIDKLGAEIAAPRPDPDVIHRHIGVLRSFPELEARVANWLDDPRTQRFIADIDQIGL